MAAQSETKKDWARYITELFEANPELQKECEQVKNAIVSFSNNHTSGQLERFTDAWGRYDTRMLASILNVPECCLQKFFTTLLNKRFS